MQTPEQISNATFRIRSTTEALEGLRPLLSNAPSKRTGLTIERFKTPGQMATRSFEFENQHHVAVVWTGKIKENTGGMRSMAGPNSLVLPVGQAWQEAILSGVSFTDFAVNPEFLHKVAREADLPDQFELTPQWGIRDRQMERLAEAAEHEISSGLSTGNLFMESLATALAAHVVARYSSRSAPPREYRGGMSPYQLGRTREFIEANLGEDFGLAELAANVRLSPYYFCRLFKQSTRLSPHQFVIRERIHRAQQLLKEHRLPMVEIANNLGFSDQSHFARVFRVVVGTTPKHYSSQH